MRVKKKRANFGLKLKGLGKFIKSNFLLLLGIFAWKLHFFNLFAMIPFFFLSIQIGIVDIMNETRLQIQGVVGCGLSEIVAAYQDGCLSREQCVRLAYLIGKLLKECSSICLYKLKRFFFLF